MPISPGIRTIHSASFLFANGARTGLNANKVASEYHDQLSFPIWTFLTISEAEKIRESKIPATVNVPPIIAQTWKIHRKWAPAWQNQQNGMCA